MEQYIALGRHILENGNDRGDRTGTGTRSVFGYQFRHDMSKGFPLLTTKKVHLKSIIHELLWFLQGSTNNNELKANGVSIWDEWAVKVDTERKLTIRERFDYAEKNFPDYNRRSYTLEDDSKQDVTDYLDDLGIPRTAPAEVDFPIAKSELWTLLIMKSDLDDNLVSSFAKWVQAKADEEGRLVTWREMCQWAKDNNLPYTTKKKLRTIRDREQWAEIFCTEEEFLGLTTSITNIQNGVGGTDFHEKMINDSLDFLGVPRIAPGQLHRDIYLTASTLYHEVIQPSNFAEGFENWVNEGAGRNIDRRGVGAWLKAIQDWCLERDLPITRRIKVLEAPVGMVADGELGPIYGKQWRLWDDVKIVPNDRIDQLRQMGYEYFDETYHADDQTTYAIMVKKFDQISELIEGLKNKPFSRRHIVSAWNVADLPNESISPQENVQNDKMALAPCHCLFQFYVREIPGTQRIDWVRKHLPEEASRVDQQLMVEIEEGKFSGDDDNWDDRLIARNYELYGAVPGVPKYYLDCQLYQRSADYCVGVPYNVASYGLLLMMVAQCTGMLPGEFVHTFGDVHIYNSHLKTFVEQQLERSPYPLPTMKLNPNVKDIFGFKISDFELSGYDPHPAIKYDISV